MPTKHIPLTSPLKLLAVTLFLSLVCSRPNTLDTPPRRDKRDNNPLNIDWSPAPSPQDGPPFSAGALRDRKYLPAQIAGLVAAYGVSLVLVAITLLSLASKRREHLQLRSHQTQFVDPKTPCNAKSPSEAYYPYPASNSPRQAPPDFPHLWPLQHRRHDKQQPLPHHLSSPQTQPSTSNYELPCVGPAVDPSVVSAHDTIMAKSQSDGDDVKQQGLALDAPLDPGPSPRISSSNGISSSTRKDRAKPANLNLSAAPHQDKTQSKASLFLASLLSPRKKHMKGVKISAPILTPLSGTFSRHELQEWSEIPPRHYAPPPPPPPIPTDQIPFGAQTRNIGAPPTPKRSIGSIQSINQRINTQASMSKASHAASEADPASATSENLQTPIAGLPSSPKTGTKSPTLPIAPSTPKSGGAATFAAFATTPSTPKPGAAPPGANSPSAVRIGGNLPLRAYEPATGSSSVNSQTTKKTVLERRGPLSPTTGQTIMTAGAVPYSPYQPFTPVIPVTPTLVTRQDRKRMKKMMPKTPTMEMVKDSDELW